MWSPTVGALHGLCVLVVCVCVCACVRVRNGLAGRPAESAPSSLPSASEFFGVHSCGRGMLFLGYAFFFPQEALILRFSQVGPQIVTVSKWHSRCHAFLQMGPQSVSVSK